MTWWAWTLLWIVLVAVAGLVLFLAVRRLLRQGTALAREFADVTDRLAEVTRALEDMPGDPAVAERAPAPVRHRHRQSTTRASSRGHR